MLTVQHRMHPSIGRLISSVFYEEKLKHAVNATDRDHGLDWLPKAVTWFSTTRLPQHAETRQGSSYYNRSEVKGREQLLRRRENSYRTLEITREVAIITPYNAQITELEANIQPAGPDWQALKIEIAVIDAFQGRDRDIVLYSTVRSHKNAHLGFPRDRRRLNVALSRAQQLLILIGAVWTLENGRAGADGNPYQDLVKYIRENPHDCALEDLEGQ
jgi:superfamily I DNA and/or RNA helicase